MTEDCWEYPFTMGRLFLSLSEMERVKVWGQSILSIEEVREIADTDLYILRIVDGIALMRHMVTNNLYIANFRSILGTTTHYIASGGKRYHRQFDVWKAKQLVTIINQRVYG